MINQDRVLVTGGAGFIGSHLVEEFLKNDFKVYVWGRSNNTFLDKEIDFQVVDLKNKVEVEKNLDLIKPHFIVHLATELNVNRDDSFIEEMMQNNFFGTLNLYRAALKLTGLKAIINTGTCEEYGQNQTPYLETQKELPVSPYSLSKVCTTYLSKFFNDVYKLPIITVRPFLTYGEGQKNKQLIPLVIDKFLKNEEINTTFGEQTRDFIYVKDVVDAIIIIMQNHQGLMGEIINISTGQEIKIKRIIQLIKEETNSHSKINWGALDYRPGENMHFFGSNEKIKTLVGWQPKYSLIEGIRKTVEWYKNDLS